MTASALKKLNLRSHLLILTSKNLFDRHVITEEISVNTLLIPLHYTFVITGVERPARAGRRP